VAKLQKILFKRMKTDTIIGREKEIAVLNSLLKSSKSEFAAIYGRRRVGKSFLVEEVFRGKIAFELVGTFLKDKDDKTYKSVQLGHFYNELLDLGYNPDTTAPQNWREAFRMLKNYLETLKVRRKVIFLDELPWLAGRQSSEMIAELGYFWNSWANRQRNIVLIVCGSATSWMLDNVIRDYGGLHGRLTKMIHLLPFTLKECEMFFKKRGFHLSRYEIAVNYMVMGGIPYYLDKLQNNNTLTENIDEIFFKNTNIHQEFRDVYTGLFSSNERYVEVVKILSKKFYGMTRNEIMKASGISGGGTLSKIIDNLLQSDIIREYPRFGASRLETVYQLKDFFTLFYFNFLENKTLTHSGNWKSIQRTAQFYSWAGNTFEILVVEHISQLAEALRIATVSKSFCYKGQSPTGSGAQIDLVLQWEGERTDYLCEIKFSESEYIFSADYQRNILNKLDAFVNSKQHKKTHSVQIVLVTTMGLVKNEHSSAVNQVVTFDDLFKC